MTVMTTVEEISNLKARLKATWMAGNYDYFSRFMESSAVEFLDRIGVEIRRLIPQLGEPLV